MLYRESGGIARLSTPVGPYRIGENVRFLVGLVKDPFGGVNSDNPYIAQSAVTLQLSIGSEYLFPNRGEWEIGTGAATSTDISYNATTAQVKNAISGVYGNVTVAPYGSTVSHGWIITAATANTALTVLGQSLSLSPYSTVEVLDLTGPSTGVTAQKIVRLRRQPALSKTFYGNVLTFSAPTLTTVTINDKFALYELEYDKLSRYFPYFFNMKLVTTGHAGNSVTLASPQIQTNLPRSVIVDGDDPNLNLNDRGLIHHAFRGTFRGGRDKIFYSPITFSDNQRLFTVITNGTATFYGYLSPDIYSLFVSTKNQDTLRLSLKGNATSVLLSLDGSSGFNPLYGAYSVGVITFSGAQLDELFLEAKRNEITLTLEVNLIEDGRQQSLLQTPVRIERTVA